MSAYEITIFLSLPRNTCFRKERSNLKGLKKKIVKGCMNVRSNGKYVIVFFVYFVTRVYK